MSTIGNKCFLLVQHRTTEKLKPRPLKLTKDRSSSSTKQLKLYKGAKRLTNAQRTKLIKDNFVKETSRIRTFTPQDMPGNKEFAKWFNNLILDLKGANIKQYSKKYCTGY